MTVNLGIKRAGSKLILSTVGQVRRSRSQDKQELIRRSDSEREVFYDHIAQ